MNFFYFSVNFSNSLISKINSTVLSLITISSLHRPVADLLYAPKDRLVHNTYSMYCTHLHTVTF